MYLNLVILVMVALAGFSSKMLDGFAVRKMAKDFAYILINLSFIIAGTLAAITISPEVVISLLIALILMGKIDKLGLRIGYALVLLLTLALMRDSSVLSPISVVILVVCAMVDETEIRIIRDYRPSMWIGTIAIGSCQATGPHCSPSRCLT